jgi:hypothetical protein
MPPLTTVASRLSATTLLGEGGRAVSRVSDAIDGLQFPCGKDREIGRTGTPLEIAVAPASTPALVARGEGVAQIAMLSAATVPAVMAARA